MTKDPIDLLNDVIAVLRGGAAFYREAEEKAENTALKELFRENAIKREGAVDELSREVTVRGEEPAEGSWAEKAYSWYATTMASLTDADDILVSQLEEHEDRTLEALREAIDDLPDHASGARDLLNRNLAVFRETHEKMRALKKAS